MPLPNQIHRDKALENISVAYKNDRLIASQLSPSVKVKHESDLWYTYSREQLILPQTLRGNGAVATEVDYTVSTTTYVLNAHGVKQLVTDRDRDNADAAIKPDIDATEYLTQLILMRREADLLELIGTTANWANVTSLTSTFAWSANTSLSNPIAFVDSAASVIAQNSGKLPNVVAMDDRTFRAAKEHTQTVDRVKFTSPESLGPAILARLFNVDQVLVSGAIQNTGQELLSETMAFMMTDAAWIGYVERSPGLRKPSALYTLEQTSDGSPYMVKKWREEERGGDFVEVNTKFRHVVPASQCAYIIANTVQ